MAARHSSWRCTVLMAGLSFFMAAAWVTAGERDFPKDLIPEADFVKLYVETVKQMQEYARSQSSLNQDYKKLENEAYHLIVLCAVQRKIGDEASIRKAIAAQNAGKVIAAAAVKKDHATVRQLLTDIADWNKIQAEEAIQPQVKSLIDDVPMDNFMKGLVQPLFDRFDKTPRAYRNLNAANFNAKLPEIQLACYKMAIYSWATYFYVPEADDIPKGKSDKDWEKWTADMMKASEDLLAATKAKKQSDLRSAVRRLDSSCTKCHDDFRMKD